MLRLNNIINKIETVKNESDFYVKIKIILGHRFSLNEPICYWSSLCSDGSLIEIGIKKLDGVIHEITILPGRDITINHAALVVDNKVIVEKNGLPAFYTKEWLEDDPNVDIEGYYARKNEDFEIYAGEKIVSILFSPHEITLRVNNGPIAFCFDKDGFLCLIQMTGMRLNGEGFLEQIS